MLKALIIEDEPNNLEALERDLKKHCPEIRVAETCASAREGLWAIEKHRPDIVFLDIEMPRMNAFEMLAELPEIGFDIIFTTAHGEYARQAFEVSAIDYLLKPIDREKLKTAVARCLEKQERATSKAQIDLLLQNMQTAQPGLRRLAIPTLGRLDFVKIDDILFCEADGNVTKIVVAGQAKIFVITRNLGRMEEQLASFPQFFRAHHKYLVNLDHLVEYLTNEKIAVMEGGHKLIVSHTRVAEFMKKVRG